MAGNQIDRSELRIPLLSVGRLYTVEELISKPVFVNGRLNYILADNIMSQCWAKLESSDTNDNLSDDIKQKLKSTAITMDNILDRMCAGEILPFTEPEFQV
jgi:hypothetical protein